jgi:hypothetical protein
MHQRAKHKIHEILNSSEDKKAERLKKQLEANQVTPSPDSAYTHHGQQLYYGSIFTSYRGEQPGAHIYRPGFTDEEEEEQDTSRTDRMQFGSRQSD